MLALLLALQQPAAQVDTFPLQARFIDAMPAGKAIVNRNDSVSYKFENSGDTAMVVYKDGARLAFLKNSIPDDSPIPDPSDEPVWEGGGLKVIFMSRRVSESGLPVGTIGVVRE